MGFLPLPSSLALVSLPPRPRLLLLALRLAAAVVTGRAGDSLSRSSWKVSASHFGVWKMQSLNRWPEDERRQLEWRRDRRER